MNTGLITLSAELTNDYSEELKKNNINVIPLTMDDFDQHIKNLDAVIIREDAVEDVSQTCGLLLKIRESSDALVWVFSTNSAKVMRIVYLQLGAVGVLSDDCEANELQLIISNSLGRAGGQIKKKKLHRERIAQNEQDSGGEAKPLQLIPRNFSVKIDNDLEIPLTKLEYKTLEFLYTNANTAVTYKEIFEEVWEKRFDQKNYRVANLIFHLRDKLEKDSLHPRFIKTVRSKGYMLSLDG